MANYPVCMSVDTYTQQQDRYQEKGYTTNEAYTPRREMCGNVHPEVRVYIRTEVKGIQTAVGDLRDQHLK